MGKNLIWNLIQLALIPFKIVAWILETFFHLFIAPIMYGSLKHGPAELFVWFLIIGTLVIFLRLFE